MYQLYTVPGNHVRSLDPFPTVILTNTIPVTFELYNLKMSVFTTGILAKGFDALHEKRISTKNKIISILYLLTVSIKPLDSLLRKRESAVICVNNNLVHGILGL